MIDLESQVMLKSSQVSRRFSKVFYIFVFKKSWNRFDFSAPDDIICKCYVKLRNTIYFERHTRSCGGNSNVIVFSELLLFSVINCFYFLLIHLNN